MASRPDPTSIYQEVAEFEIHPSTPPGQPVMPGWKVSQTKMDGRPSPGNRGPEQGGGSLLNGLDTSTGKKELVPQGD